MSLATLTIAAAYGIAIGFVYLYVGRQVGKRQVAQKDALAQKLFSAWWYALGASTLLGAVQLAFYMSGSLALWMYQAFQQTNLLLVVVGLLGLLYYLLYLYTGSRRVLVPLALFYLAFYVALQALIIGNAPAGLTDDGWALQAEPQIELTPSAVWVFILAILGPQIGASIALFALYFKTEGRAQRYRIALVSGAIFTWFGVVLVANAAGLGETGWWPPASRLLGLAAALSVLAAYRPPRWVQRRYGISPIQEAS